MDNRSWPQREGQRQSSSSTSSSSDAASTSYASSMPFARRRLPSHSSSLSNVTTYAEQQQEQGEGQERALHAAGHDTTSNNASASMRDAPARSPPRPVSSLTRSITGLPLALEQTQASTSTTSSQDSDMIHSSKSPARLPTSAGSGIAQQRPHATAALSAVASTSSGNSTTTPASSAPSSPFASLDSPGSSSAPQYSQSPSNASHTHPFAVPARTRPHATSISSTASHSSVATSSSSIASSTSPPASYTSSLNQPGSARGGGGGFFHGYAASSPPTSVGTGVSGSGSGSGHGSASAAHSRQASHAALPGTAGGAAFSSSPIAIAPSGSSAPVNLGIGISTTASPLSAPSPSTTAAAAAGLIPSSGSTISSPSGITGLATTANAASSPLAVQTGPVSSSVQNRLSTTPFLPSPLAQASLAPGEDEGEYLEHLGLDSSPPRSEERLHRRPLEATTSAIVHPVASGSSLVPTGSGIRRSTSVSQVGYKGSSTRRRISSISQQQQQLSLGSSALGLSQPAANSRANTSSAPSSASTTGPPSALAASAAAAAIQRPSSPSPLRNEASLLTISRDPLTTAGTHSTVSTTPSVASPQAKATSSHNDNSSGSSSDTSTSGGAATHSPTPRPVKYHNVGFPGASAQSSPGLSESEVSPSSQTQSRQRSSRTSDTSPSDYRFPPNAAAVRARQTSVSSAGSSASASSAPALRPAGQISPLGTAPVSIGGSKSLSPPAASGLSMSASSPGLSYAFGGAQRSASVSHSRGTHGRSESLASALGVSGVSGSGSTTMSSAASSAGLSTSPTTSVRQFPSAPPYATPSLLSSSFSFSPLAAAGSSALSPPTQMQSGPLVTSPSTSVSSASSSKVDHAAGSSGSSGGIRLQRVPTSVRLAQELHPSPVVEKRRGSADAGSGNPALSKSTASSLSAFKIGGPEDEPISSNSSSSETEHRGVGSLGLRLPATPMATRRNTPSPSGNEEATDYMSEGNLAGEAAGSYTAAASAGSSSHSTGLASPFHSFGHGPASSHSQTGSSSNISPTASMRSASISTPPLSNTSAYAPLFPFSIPRSIARTSLSTALADNRVRSSPPTLSRSVSKSRSPAPSSPVLGRRSPKLANDPFAGSQAIADPAHSTAMDVSPKNTPRVQQNSDSFTVPAHLSKRKTISGLAPSLSTSLSTSGLISEQDKKELDTEAATSPPLPIGSQMTISARTSPTSIRKHFRTSMMPGTISTTSTEDYARHLQESRASKLRKWANTSSQPTERTVDETTGAGNTFGAGSDVHSSSKARRRAGIPDFAELGFDKTEESRDYRDELAGDIGVRPGTAASREVEWVDWLDEYKRMKEAKIRSEQEMQRQLSLGDVEEGAEAELDDVALDLEPAPGHSRKRSDEQSYQGLYSRKGSDDRSEGAVPFPPSRGSEDSGDFHQHGPPRVRRLSTASLASLGMLDASKRKRSSQESFMNAQRAPAPAPVPVPSTVKKPQPMRSISYAPPTAYSSLRQDQAQAQAQAHAASSAQSKKRKVGAKIIESWWHAVAKVTSSHSKKTPPPPLTPLARASPAADIPQNETYLTTSVLAPAVSIDPAELPGRTSAQYARDATLIAPPTKLRHTASASDLTPEKKIYGASHVPTGALAPAAKVARQPFEPHGRLNSAGSDGSNGSSSGTRSEFKRRNPQLSLRLDYRLQHPGLTQRLSDQSQPSQDSSASQSSTSGGPLSNRSPPVFKEPRPPSASRHSDRLPGLTPGQSPIWDQTPGLVPTSQSQALRLARSASKTSSLQRTPSVAPAGSSFSVSHIREHIKHRLTGAKHSCDKELRKIVNGITTYVENELENERAFASSIPPSRQEEEIGQETDIAFSHSPAPLSGPDSGAELGAAPLLPHYPGRPDYSRTDTGSSSSAPRSTPHSGFGSPTLTFPLHHQRHSPQSGSGIRGRTSGKSSPRRTSLQTKRAPLGMPVQPSELAARLEKSLDLKAETGPGEQSQVSSRSTSRSRSPMPFKRRASAGKRTTSAEWFKKHNQQEDEGKRSFLHALQTIVAISMEILDTSVTELTDDPSTCAQLIRRVQKVGQSWDDNPNWPLRGWYVQLLLAVAGLSRVAEFWAEERGFWNFGDEKDNTEHEPITFVAKASQFQEDNMPASQPRSRATSAVVGLARVPSRTEEGHAPSASPLGADLGIHRVEEEAPADTSMKVVVPPAGTEETSRAEEAEVLREAVEEVRNATILMELALDGESFQYLSPIWEDVVGLPTSVCIGRPISHLLPPEDAAVFADASKHLQEDDSHTIEAHFRLRIFAADENPDDHSEEVFEAMEGKGMLVRDRVHGEPSHTMWVIRPVPTLTTGSEDGEATTVRPSTASYARAFREPITPFVLGKDGELPIELLLCRICDRQIPTWFFEKHNETCNETHRLDVDISEVNDKLSDLRGLTAALLEHLKKPVEMETAEEALEYMDMPLLPARYKDSQVQVLEELMETLNAAIRISTPALSDEQMPVESQRLLSPNSEDHLISVQNWSPPSCEDPALRRLASDLVDLCRQKIIAVNRLRNTIVYVERVRLEWEHRAHAMLGASSGVSPPPSPAPTVQPDRGKVQAISEQPTPVPATVDSFLSPQERMVPIQPLSGSGSPASMNALSPAGLLHPLPMIEKAYPSSADDSSTGMSVAKSPLSMPTSPRIPLTAPSRNAKASTSIKDFDIIKPISKGAFGSVYLAKKRNTGDYFAIKVLRKADMIAKNQVTNVKAERKIMMTQADSDFAVKLYWTFQSKDYLYLVMEYLNGGDCGALIKVIGCLDEEWAKAYVAEIVLGLEYLHGRGIVHRDLKPDNLLIDSRGHLRLTDFGLSRFGLLGRQARTINQSSNQLGRKLHQRNLTTRAFSGGSQASTPDSQPRASYFGSAVIEESDALSESSESESVADKQKATTRSTASPANSLDVSSGRLLPAVPSPGHQAESRRFVGTVDYVAPESILGVGVGECVDWWALGVICHEFITSCPPFHAATAEEVFDNILSRRIDWHEDEVDMSSEARDFIERLLCSDPTRRLGAKGADEVKRHPFLAGIDWAGLRTTEANFVPQVVDPESTDYFDARGATAQVFEDDAGPADVTHDATSAVPGAMVGTAQEVNPLNLTEVQEEKEPDDFGTFSFKNLDVLKQANDDVIRKLRKDSLIPPDTSVDLTNEAKRKSKRYSMNDPRNPQPPSPSTSTSSSIGSGFSRPSAPNTPFGLLHGHTRQPSGQSGARLKVELPGDEDLESFSRRNSMPGRLRRASFAQNDRRGQGDALWHQRRRTSGHTEHIPASSVSSPVSKHAALPAVTGEESEENPQVNTTASEPLHKPEKAIECLIAEDNPISSKILETILGRLGCLCVVVHNGEEAIRCSMGEIKFDVIFMDMLMPILDGENAARMIKSTKNANQDTPIVAVTSYAAHERAHITEEGTLFNAVLAKPVSKGDVLNVLTKLGFVAKAKAAPTAIEANSNAPAEQAPHAA